MDLHPDDEERVLDRARRAERFVASVYGGTLREPYDPVGDVDLPDGNVVDVKSVPTPAARFVNGGAHRPSSLVVVVSGRPQLVLGLVFPGQWRDAVPDVSVVRRPKRCWHVLRAECFPPPPGWIRIGCVDPEWWLRPDDELLHDDWNDRNRRRVERAASAPVPMPWADPESVRRGTGLAGRKGHAPGRDNWRRRRPS